MVFVILPQELANIIDWRSSSNVAWLATVDWDCDSLIGRGREKCCQTIGKKGITLLKMSHLIFLVEFFFKSTGFQFWFANGFINFFSHSLVLLEALKKKKGRLFLNIWFPAPCNLHDNASVEKRYDNFTVVGRLVNWNRKEQAKELLFPAEQ